MIMQRPESDLRTLITLAEMKADRVADGHLTIMRFTTHWKILLGTPDLDSRNGGEKIRQLSEHESLEAALSYFIIR